MNTVTSNISIVFGLFILVFIIMIVSAKNRKKILIYPFQVGGEQDESQYVKVVIKGTKWNDVTVGFAGKQVGVFHRKALYAGMGLPLPDGSLLELQLSRNQFQPEQLKISRNGQPIHRIVTDSMYQVLIDYASNAIYFIGISTMGLGIVSLFFRIKILEPLTFGWPYIVFGAVFIVLGFFVRRRSMLALMIAIIIYALDGLVGLAIILAALSTGSYILIGNPLAHIGFLAAMINGIDGINGTRQKPKSRIVAVLIIIFAVIIGSSPFVIMYIGYINIMAVLHPDIRSPLPQVATLGVALPAGSCTLIIKGTSNSVYIRDKADVTNGKIVDYLDANDIASVLGGDGGLPGDSWWYITTTHRDKTSQGWVFGNVVDLENSPGCSNIRQIATPFP